MTGPNHSDLYRGLGEVEGRLGAMDDRLNKIETVVERIDTRLARMEATESQRSGAFKLGQWLFAGLTGLVSFLAAHFLK